jgi:hypothetical protein
MNIIERIKKGFASIHEANSYLKDAQNLGVDQVTISGSVYDVTSIGFRSHHTIPEPNCPPDRQFYGTGKKGTGRLQNVRPQ